MSQRSQLLDLFRINGGKVSLRTILETTLAAEYRARISELRREGYGITCVKGPTPSENLYVLDRVPVKFEVEPSGQMRIAI